MVREQGRMDNPIGAMWVKILAKVEDLQWKGSNTSGVTPAITADLDICRAAKLMIDEYSADV
jgi:hypothetical protein